MNLGSLSKVQHQKRHKWINVNLRFFSVKQAFCLCSCFWSTFFFPNNMQEKYSQNAYPIHAGHELGRTELGFPKIDLNQSKGGRCPNTVIYFSTIWLRTLVSSPVLEDNHSQTLTGLYWGRGFESALSITGLAPSSSLPMLAEPLTWLRGKRSSGIWLGGRGDAAEGSVQTGPGSCMVPTEDEDSLMEAT